VRVICDDIFKAASAIARYDLWVIIIESILSPTTGHYHHFLSHHLGFEKLIEMGAFEGEDGGKRKRIYSPSTS